MDGLALFAGGGGLELGLSLALGTDYRTIAYVEREATSAAVLAANMERGWLDKAPIWDDVGTFTGDVVSPLVDKIDIISAGFPCQPWSYAGTRRGTEDQRWLWDDIRRLAVEIRPRYLFLENTPGLLVHSGIGTILGDLSEIGFNDVEWTSVRASDVGAPHRRERVFILAHTGHDARRSEQEQQHTLETTGVGQSSTEHDVGDTNDEGLQGRQQPVGQRAHELPAWPPGPSDTDAWAAVLRERPDLAPAIESEVRGMDDGTSRGLARATQLRILGNGVVPQQAALAFHILKERITDGSASTSK